jgi:DNA-binding XRE family transcriptional regulator
MSAAFSLFAERLVQALDARVNAHSDAFARSILLSVLCAVMDARALVPLAAPNIGDMLKQARARADLSLAEVCEAARISKGHLWELENGKQTNPSLDVMRKLSAVLAIKPEDWFR